MKKVDDYECYLLKEEARMNEGCYLTYDEGIIIEGFYLRNVHGRWLRMLSYKGIWKDDCEMLS